MEMISCYVIVLLSTLGASQAVNECTGAQGKQVNLTGYGCLNFTTFSCFRAVEPGGLCKSKSSQPAFTRLNLATLGDKIHLGTKLLQPRDGPRCWNNSAGRQCCYEPCQNGNPCFNDGKCLPSGAANESFTCKCSNQAFSGAWCQKNSKCSKCHQNANCNHGTEECTCKQGYDGDGQAVCRAICPTLTKSNVFAECGFNDLTFNQTYGTVDQESNERCNGRPVGRMTCPESAVAFENASFHCVRCDVKSVSDLEEPNSNTSVSDIEKRLNDARVVTDKEETPAAEVKETLKYLNKLADALGNKTELSEKSLTNAMEVLQNIDKDLAKDDGIRLSKTDVEKKYVETDGETKKKRNETRNSAMEVLDKVARRVKLPENKIVEVTTGELSVKIVEPDVTGDSATEVIFNPEANQPPAPDAKANAVPPKKQTLKMTIPVDTLKNMEKIAGTATSSMRLVFVLHQDASLLTVDKRTGQVVQVTFRPNGTKETTPLYGKTIKIEFSDPPKNTSDQNKVIEKTNYRLNLTYFCVFWDFLRQDWATEGCEFSGNSEHASCVCDHLTSFALLLRVTKVLKDYEPDLYSLVACGLSVLCLVTTILIYVLVTDLRIRRPTPILVNVCVNLAAGYLMFIVGMDGRFKGFSNVWCYFSAVLMHFVFLCAWFWMLIYSLNMYYALVKVVVGRNPLVSKKAFMYIVGYGLPVIIVGVDLVVSYQLDEKPHKINDIDFMSHYISPHICWVRHMSMYLAFAAPVGVILFVNIILFFLIIRKLTWKRAEIQSSREATTVPQQLFMAVTVVAMMGLTWIFGYIMLIWDEPDFQKVMGIIFNIFNTCQGIVIFLVSCVRQKAVRNMWVQPIKERCCCCARPKKAKGMKSFTDDYGTTTDTGLTAAKRQMSNSTAL